MNHVIETRRVFVAGQLIEYWENGELPFGSAAEDLQSYAERGEWVLLFNALALTAPRPESGHGS